MTAYIVSSGVVSSGLTPGPADTLTVLGGGTLTVGYAGVASGVILSDGDEYVTGVDSGAVLRGGTQLIKPGGLAVATTVDVGGAQTVALGAVARGVTVGAGGVETVEGVISGATILSGGRLQGAGEVTGLADGAPTSFASDGRMI
jgi:autotransporter passenger strand-loop-strand repeat protein